MASLIFAVAGIVVCLLSMSGILDPDEWDPDLDKYEVAWVDVTAMAGFVVLYPMILLGSFAIDEELFIGLALLSSWFLLPLAWPIMLAKILTWPFMGLPRDHLRRKE